MLAFLLFAISFGVRLIGIQWGLPTEQRHQSLHPDELVIKEFADRTPYFRPGFYNYGTLYLTVLKVASDMGRTYGYVPEGKDIPQWRIDRAIHLTGRVISALAASAATVFLFLILWSISGVLGSCFGGILMTAAPAFLVHSRFQTSDILATTLITVSAYLLFLFIQSPERIRWLYGSAVVAGLSTGTKYSGILFLLPILYVLFVESRNHFWKQAAVSLAWLLIGFIFATPGVLLETQTFWTGFTYELQHTAHGHGIVFADTPSGFVYHIGNLIDSLGLLPFFLGLAGIAFAIAKKQRWMIAFFIFVFAYYVLIGRAEVKFVRYVFPLVPFFILGAAFLVSELVKGVTWKKATGLFLLLATAFGIRAQVGPITLTQLMAQKDPRDQAATWLQEAHPGESVGFVTDPWFYSPPIFPNSGLLGAENRLEAMKLESLNSIRYVRTDGSRIDWDRGLIEIAKPDLIVFSSFEFIDNDRVNQPDFSNFLPLLFQNYDLVAVFWGPTPRIADSANISSNVGRELLRKIIWEDYPIRHDLMYIQPTICVFQKKQPTLNRK